MKHISRDANDSGISGQGRGTQPKHGFSTTREYDEYDDGHMFVSDYFSRLKEQFSELGACNKAA